MANAHRRLRWNFTEPLQLGKGAIFSDDATRWLLTSRFLGADLDFRDNAPPKVALRIVNTRVDERFVTATVTVDASDDRELRTLIFYDGREDTVVGGRALTGRSVTFTQELQIARPKSGGVQIGAFVSDIGGNMSKVMAVA